MFGAILTMFAVRTAFSPLPQGSGDPGTFAQESYRFAKHRLWLAGRDPPARYWPLAILIRLFGIEHFAYSGRLSQTTHPLARLTHLYFSLLWFVGAPVTIYVWLRQISSWKLAFSGSIIAITIRFSDLAGTFWTKSYFQYVQAEVLLLVTIATITYFSRHQEGLSSTRSGVVLGVFVGLTGLSKFLYRALAAAVVIGVSLLDRRVHQLAVAGLMGSLVGSVLFGMPRRFWAYQLTRSQQTINGWRDSLPALVMGVVDEVAKEPVGLMLLFFGIGSLLLYRVSMDSWPARSAGVPGVVLAISVCWVLFGLGTYDTWHAMEIAFGALGPIIFVGAILTILSEQGFLR